MGDATKKIPFTLINCETTRTIRALLIDAEQRSITEIEIELSGDDKVNEKRFARLLHLDCDVVEVVGWVDDTEIDGVPVGDLVLAIENASDDPETHWFQLDDQEPIADYGLVVGCELGKRYSAEISVEELRKRVTFARGDCHTVFANMLK